MNNIEKAFEAVSRVNFLPQDAQDRVNIDAPIPIGYGQTNSQPTTVRLMLTWLDPRPGDTILDVGAGSGWTTALLAHLAGKQGKVYAVEKVPKLVRFGELNCKKVGVKNAYFYKAGSIIGLPEYAPYDRILVSAAASKFPSELLSQLRVGGTLVIPVKNSIYVINRTSKESYESSEYPGFVFVPLV